MGFPAEAHGQLQSDSESHIERQRELTTQAQNELEALRKQLQSAGADHQAAAETLTAEMDALREAKAGLEDEVASLTSRVERVSSDHQAAAETLTLHQEPRLH